MSNGTSIAIKRYQRLPETGSPYGNDNLGFQRFP